MQVKIANIRLPQLLVRKVVDESGLESLARSIRKLGVLLPLLVRKDGDDYELISGMRRLYAAEMVGLITVPAIVKRIDPEDAESIKVAENKEREDVNPIDEGEYFRDVMDATGQTQKGLAKEMGVSEAYLSQRVATAKWDERTKMNVRKGALTFSAARELEKITDTVEKKRLVGIAVEGGITPAVASQWRREVNRVTEARSSQEELEMERTPVHLPQKVYVPCMTCTEAVEVERVIFLRICQDCHGIIMKGGK